MQQEATKAVDMISESKTQASEGVDAVVAAEQALENITKGVSLLRETNNIVASSTEQQATVTHEINRNLVEMQSEEADTLNASEKMAQASQELQRLAEQLDLLVVSYRQVFG